MNILHIILIWLSFFAGYLLWAKVRENIAQGRKPWDFDNFNFLVGSVTFFLVLWTVIFVARPEPVFDTKDEQIAYGKATNQPWLVSDAIWDQLKTEPTNPDIHYEFVKYHYLQRNSDLSPPDPFAFAAEEVRLFDYYSELSESPNDTLHDIGHLFLAAYCLGQSTPDYSGASFHLRLIEDPTRKYVNYYAGKIVLIGAGSPEAEKHFLSEIRNKGFKEGAYEYLAIIYDLEDKDTTLNELVYSGAADFVPEDLRARVYYQEKDLLRFYQLKFTSLLKGINLWGLAGATAILLIWLFFLVRLSFLSLIRFRHILLSVVIGTFLAMTSWWLYAFYKHGLGFWVNGNIGNDLLFCFTGIGVIEELVKLIPFLLILHFTGIIKKPIDYLIVASASGLGFAFFENLMYIANYGLDVIHSRALTASVSHMACSAMVAYGFVLYKFRWPKRWWLIPLFFLLASAAHGFYDFWLINASVKSFSILTLVFYLSEILIYISFLNNALNHSADPLLPKESILFNSRKLTSVLAGSLILLFAFEYLATCFVYGTTYGNSSITTAFLSGGYLIFFLSVRMSQIRVEPGKWKPIDFLSGLLPSQLLEAGRRKNHQAILHHSVVLRSASLESPWSTVNVSRITITRNIVVKQDPHWYEATSDAPLNLNGFITQTVYLNPVNSDEWISTEQDSQVNVYYLVGESENQEPKKLVFFDCVIFNLSEPLNPQA